MPGATLSVAKHTFELVFNRALDPVASWVDVTDEDGSPIETKVAIDPTDPRRLTIRLLEPTEGSFALHWHAQGIESRVSAEGSIGFVLRRNTPAPPRIDVSPPIAEIGDRLELVGKGFAKNAVVALTIGDDDQQLATAQTDGSGRFNLEARVPPTVAYGVQPISAFAAEHRAAAASVQVQWGGWPPITGSSVGSPGPDAGEVTFTLNLRNRSDYVLEHVRVTVADPQYGQEVAADPDARRQESALVWDIPVLDRGPAPPLHVTYRANRTLSLHATVEFRHRKERGCSGGECLPAFISTSAIDSEPVAPITRDEDG